MSILVAGMVLPLPPLLQLWAQACQVALTSADYCSLEVGVGCGELVVWFAPGALHMLAIDATTTTALLTGFNLSGFALILYHRC